jgi:uncharacterized protein YmfQ (DUF2313 family)
MSPEAYARQMKQLLPWGSIWPFSPSSWLSTLLVGFGDELARIDARAEDVVNEWDPSTAVQMLEDWERVLGLPEPGQKLSPITGERQIAATLKYLSRGGATPVYFEALAARLGFVATVTETATHTWTMIVDLASSPAAYTLRTAQFRSGSARSGDRVSNRSVDELERVIKKAKPAHTVALFVYTS